MYKICGVYPRAGVVMASASLGRCLKQRERYTVFSYLNKMLKTNENKRRVIDEGRRCRHRHEPGEGEGIEGTGGELHEITISTESRGADVLEAGRDEDFRQWRGPDKRVQHVDRDLARGLMGTAGARILTGERR